ncbi:hypothetical protein BDB01DRAFT_771812 [Pilobolus umbonatus]|nr:hypothetical protein BDB01DRAFT_771812 [Pilobolus umbonatus]
MTILVILSILCLFQSYMGGMYSLDAHWVDIGLLRIYCNTLCIKMCQILMQFLLLKADIFHHRATKGKFQFVV